jgi:hypothetical protein
VTRRKRQPSAAVRRAVAVERRAAELADLSTNANRGENDGWSLHICGGTPRGPAELAGWLAREIWSAS